MSALFRKLNLTDHDPVFVLNAPDSFSGELSALSPERVRLAVNASDRIGFALAFARTQQELDALCAAITGQAPGDAIAWIAYPRKSSKRYRCDFDRDSGWAVLGQAGFEPVRQVSVDEDWSALRFRRVEFIKRLTRRGSMAISEEGRRRTDGRTER